MSFSEDKSKQLARKDKSDKGSWDEKISSLCKKINSRNEYYTTSSCAGRIILIKSSEKKQENLFLFRTHSKINFNQLRKELSKLKGDVDFQQSSCILHVACSSIENAQRLVDKAKFAGWKRSGIMSTRNRIICELMSTEHLELPIMRKAQVFISDKSLKIIVSEANKKMERTWQKIRKLEILL